MGGGALGYVEVHDPAPGGSEDDEDEQDVNVTVGPERKSTETRSCTWLQRKTS